MRINNRKLLKGLSTFAGVPEGEEANVLRSVDKLDKIGEVGVRTELLEKGFDEEVVARLFRLLVPEEDTSDLLARLRVELAESPDAQEGLAELEQLREHLADPGVRERCYRFDLSMVRGLDYYTGPIFETVVEEPRIGSITRGATTIWGIQQARHPRRRIHAWPGAIVDVMEALQLFPGMKTLTQVLVAAFDADTLPEALRLATELRRAGTCVEVPLMEKGGFKKFLSYANAKGIPTVVLLGPDEIARGEVTVRNMADGSQHSVPRGEAVARLSGHPAR